MTHTLPPGWEEKTLGEVCEIERGGSPRPIKSYLTTAPNGLNWIKIGDTSPNSKYIYSVKEKIRPEGLAKSRWVQEGDFLLSNSMSFGRPYILKTNGCIHDGWLVLKQYQSNLQCDFLYYLLSSPFVQKQFQQSAQGSTVRNLNTQRVAKIIVPIPPLPEQKRIVEKLDKIFSAIDNAKSQTEKNLQNTKEIFRHSLDILLFKGKSPKYVALDQICTLISGFAFKSKEFGNFPVKVIKISNITPPIISDNLEGVNIDRYQISKLDKYLVQKNDLCIAMTGGTIGKVGKYTLDKRAYVNQRVLLLRASPKIEQQFLHYSLMSESFFNFIQANIESDTAQPNISASTIGKFSIDLPNKEKQKEIISKLNMLFHKTQELEKIYTQKLADLEELKQAVLQQAFSGKL